MCALLLQLVPDSQSDIASRKACLYDARTILLALLDDTTGDL